MCKEVSGEHDTMYHQRLHVRLRLKLACRAESAGQIMHASELGATAVDLTECSQIPF